MAKSSLLYYITDSKAFPGDGSSCRQRLLRKISEAATAGVDYIQLRERDLSSHEIEVLARDAMDRIASARPAAGSRKPKTCLLINSRTDVALAVGADGVHLPAGDVSVTVARGVWDLAAATLPVNRGDENRNETPIISISCHSIQDVADAAAAKADLALFAPVFGKESSPQTKATGLEELRAACGSQIPVLALGGISLENARSCLNAGAAGIAAIRLFQENDVSLVVAALRAG
jgi:thiamine-phosphate pyrophosphorylase